MLVILGIIVISTLILRCRVRLHLSDKQMSLFVGLGRSGPEFDLKTESSSLRIFGFRVKTIGAVEKERETEAKKEHPATHRRRKLKLTMSFDELLTIGSRVLRTLWRTQRSLLRRVEIEELNGKLVGGFDSPDQTGIAYGWYQAALAVAPSNFARRFTYIPFWQGAHLSGTLNASVAIPLYKVVYELLALLVRLPLRKIVTLTIGKKERKT